MPFLSAQYLGDCDLGVVIKNPCRDGAEVRKRSHMTFEERLCGLGRERHYKAVVRVRQIHRQVVRLLLHSGDHHQRFAEVRLCFARRMRQRNEHLPAV